MVYHNDIVVNTLEIPVQTAAYGRIMLITTTMSYFFIIPSYLIWHYSEALKDITRVWTNFLWFISNFFSLPLLFKTFFAPWKRIEEKRPRGFSLEIIAEVVIANTLMRFVGAVIRFGVVVVGIVAILFVFWFGIFFFVLWLLLPVLAPLSFIYGVANIVS